MPRTKRNTKAQQPEPRTPTYNGWTNYETWAVKLWIDNEEGSYNYWRERTHSIFLTASPKYTWETKRDRAKHELAEALKDEHEEGSPAGVTGIYSDLLGAALDSVNWREIAESMLDSMAEAAEYDKDTEVLEAWNSEEKGKE